MLAMRSRNSLVLSILILIFAIVAVHAQGASPSPAPSPSPEPTTDPLPTVTASASVSVAPTATKTANPTPTPSLVPVFSTSDSCQACQAQYAAIYTCQTHLSNAVNLTMISQVLPFYSCICQNNGTLIDALHQCSLCFASTNQQQFLAPAFHNNVSSQDVKALKQVCVDTANGSQIPNWASSLTVSGLVWTAMFAAVVMVFVPLGGLA